MSKTCLRLQEGLRGYTGRSPAVARDGALKPLDCVTELVHYLQQGLMLRAVRIDICSGTYIGLCIHV